MRKNILSTIIVFACLPFIMKTAKADLNPTPNKPTQNYTLESSSPTLRGNWNFLNTVTTKNLVVTGNVNIPSTVTVVASSFSVISYFPGRVGIDIPNPQFNLQVSSNGTPTIAILNTQTLNPAAELLMGQLGSGNRGGLIFDTPGLGMSMFVTPISQLMFDVGGLGSHKMIIDATGSVTIGTSSGVFNVGNILEVHGNESITGKLYVGGTTPQTSTITAAGFIESTLNGFKFPDGTTQTTANAGSVTLSSTQTFSGQNDFAAGMGLGNSLLGTTDASPQWVYAKSIDGATQSSGCVVISSFAVVANTLVFTSTTTNQVQGMGGVLLESCAPGAICKIAVGGLVWVTMKAAVSAPYGDWLTTSTSRCLADTSTGTKPQYALGRWLFTSTAGGQAVAQMSP